MRTLSWLATLALLLAASPAAAQPSSTHEKGATGRAPDAPAAPASAPEAAPTADGAAAQPAPGVTGSAAATARESAAVTGKSAAGESADDAAPHRRPAPGSTADGASAPSAPLALGDLTTPRRALRQFLETARAADLERAAAMMDLRTVPRGERAQEGPKLARRLQRVLDRQLSLDWEKLSDVPEGDPADGMHREVVGTIALGAEQVPVALARLSPTEWKIASSTVEKIPALYTSYGPGWIADVLPEAFFRVRFAGMEAWQWLLLPFVLILAYVLGAILAWFGDGIAVRLTARTAAKWDDRVVADSRGPAKIFLTLLVLQGLLKPLALSMSAQRGFEQLCRSLLIATLAWLLSRYTRIGAEALVAATKATDDLRARGVRTQVALLRRILSITIWFVAASLILTQFAVVRHLGMSLLASAGIAGVVIGFAAQRSIASLLAGLQLSLTQPIRIGDTVVVEGELGTIEEIHLTYVVVRIWDLRCLVLPITHFLEKPFFNWTKSSTNLYGTVEVPADYTVPVDRVRAELERLCKESKLWDGKKCSLQVTLVTDRTMTVRALVSAKDADDLWDLRCLVREGLVKLLQQLDGGAYLPRARIDEAAAAARMNATRNAATGS